MQRETIEYRGKRYHRYPNSPHRHLRVYYWNHSDSKGSKNPPRALHRQMWIDAYGPIPKGHIVHHKDGDSLHNDLDNFELLSNAKHASMHGREDARREQSRRLLAVHAMPKARAWHGSEEGIAWHRKNGIEGWTPDRRQAMLRTKQCEACGKSYTTYRDFSKYCSDACVQRAAAKERRYWTDNRACALCSKGFMANRHTKTRFCGKRCAALSRRRLELGAA